MSLQKLLLGSIAIPVLASQNSLADITSEPIESNVVETTRSCLDGEPFNIIRYSGEDQQTYAFGLRENVLSVGDSFTFNYPHGATGFYIEKVCKEDKACYSDIIFNEEWIGSDDSCLQKEYF